MLLNVCFRILTSFNLVMYNSLFDPPVNYYIHTYIQPLFIHKINSKLQACGVVLKQASSIKITIIHSNKSFPLFTITN